MHHGTAHPHFGVSLGGLKYMLGAVVTTMLAEKIKTPEQRFLMMAGIGLELHYLPVFGRAAGRRNDRTARSPRRTPAAPR